MNGATADLEIKTYIREAVEDKSFVTYEIALTGTTDACDGYGSDITFATVLVTTPEGVQKNVELAVKCSKKGTPVEQRNSHRREAYFYKTILSEFTRFQIQNNVRNVFDSVPKFYKAISNDAEEVIVMENMKKSGYRLYDRKKALDIDHLSLVLREYGKFHAVSFAFRHKRKDDFDKLVAGYDDSMLHFFDVFFRKILQQVLKRIGDITEKTNETELFETCRKLFPKGTDVAMFDVMSTVEPESAILHGDCWNNNFVYQYESDDHKFPSKVSILDWQLSRLHSPVLDLSYFIYSTCSEEQLKHFDDLLDTYYTSFSTFLKELGCDPEELFSYSTLRRHWKKYSAFGFLMVTSFFHIMTCEKEEAPEFSDNVGNAEDFASIINNVHVKDEVAYQKRIMAIVNHYCKYNTTN